MLLTETSISVSSTRGVITAVLEIITPQQQNTPVCFTKYCDGGVLALLAQILFWGVRSDFSMNHVQVLSNIVTETFGCCNVSSLNLLLR